ncbi:hypothetical protein ACIPV2_07925 [Microbacterium sp. NPDC089987]|uniref:hypothetical protein n=1 Tax=Microbacterium sp. NPDC089987 TaxID=3364202 RepID=UPI0038141D57
MTTPSRRDFALMLTALLLLAVNLRLAVTTASVLLPLLIDEGALTPQAAIVIPAVPTALFAVGGVLTPWLSRRIGAVAAVTWASVAVAIGMLTRFVPHSIAIGEGPCSPCRESRSSTSCSPRSCAPRAAPACVR